MRNKKLTLLELIITILVLGLLVGLAIPQFTGVKANADVTSFKNDIDVLTKAIDESYVKEDSLPLGEKVSITDPALLDVIYASGDSASNLYKVDLSKTGKYHSKLKSVVNTDNYFIYSKETGNVFYTKGLVDGDNKTLYTLEYVGLTGVRLGAKPLVNGMSVPVTEPIQTITGSVPTTSTVEVKVNGTDLPVTIEDIVLEGDVDLMAFGGSVNIVAGIKTKTFTSEAVLSTGMNIITIKVDSQVTNFKINLGENSDPVTPEAPIIKPVAVISMTPEQGLTTSTNITWSDENSTAAAGRTITNAEWEGKQEIYTTEGSYTVKLRVQDSTGVWSDWVEKSFAVISADGIKKISVGSSYTMILKEDGTLWGTGYNGSGQLGSGDLLTKNRFIQVQSEVKDVIAGNSHTLIIKSDNSLWTTGSNSSGQLGTGDIINKKNFVKVRDNIAKACLGNAFTLVIDNNGVLWGVGDNDFGQLGTGDTIDKSSFIQVLSDVKDITIQGVAISHSAIIKNDGTLWTTGNNYAGQLGTNDNTARKVFTQIAQNVRRVTTGGNSTYYIKNDDTLWATGNNTKGQFGIGNKLNKNYFVQIATNVKDMSSGFEHNLILKNDGQLWASGYNAQGQLGNNQMTDLINFTQVGSNIKLIAAGGSSTFILKNDKTLWTSGENGYGQLGVGDTSHKTVLTQLTY